MAGETTITLVGNLTADPELRFTPSGAAVANFTVASTPRTFDRQTNEWRDGDAMFLNCAVWRQAAENVAESLQKGMRVIVQGRLKSRSYETREGERRTVFEVDVDEIGPALRYATAKVTRNSGSGGGRRRRPGGSPVAGGSQRWRLRQRSVGQRRQRRRAAGRSSRRRHGRSRPTPGRRRRATSLRSEPIPTRSSPSGHGTFQIIGLERRAPHGQQAHPARRRSPTRCARASTSTTRTPRPCGSSSPSAARSAPAG